MLQKSKKCDISPTIYHSTQHADLKLTEDREDLAIFSKRAKEPTVSFEELPKRLKVSMKTVCNSKKLK